MRVRILGTKTCQSELAADRRPGGDRACPDRGAVPAQLFESRFFFALERRDAARLWEEAWLFAPLAGLSILLSVASVWGRMTTQRKWREWLTKHLLALWLRDGRYRGLKFVAGDHQNAEYRICVDARIATDAPVDMAIGLFAALTTAAVFTGVLWTIGGSLTISAGVHQGTIPGYLVLGGGVFSLPFTAG